MSEDLKAKIAEAIEREWRRGENLVGYVPNIAEHALQAIHDAGWTLTPPTATGVAMIMRGMEAVEEFKAKYVVVPREPTEAMLRAAWHENFDVTPQGFSDIWTAMILASQPKGEGE